jgi:group II intron reverse transcriptase/maturase
VQRKDVLEAAFKAVAENGGAPGVDGESLESITETAESKERWMEALRMELKEKRYRPSPVRRVWIDKRSGGKRPLGIPTVKDRVVQAAVYLLLMPIWEADFHEQSYGFRPKRRAHQAMDAIKGAVRSGRVEVIDADLSAYFDSIPHRELMKEVAKRISDGAVLALIKAWLRAPVVEEDAAGRVKISVNRQGTPQGGVISPLLANIYLNPLDWEVNEGNRKQNRMVRYADDFVVLCPVGRGQQTQEQIKRWLEGKGLELNESKTRQVNIYREGIRFLGFRLNGRRSGRGRAYLHMEPEAGSCAALRGRLGEILNHYTRWRAIAAVVREVNLVLRGWCGYFHYGNSARVFGKAQYWVRNRLRRWVWRKHARTRALYDYYTNQRLHETYRLWKMPMMAAWTTV